MSDRLQPPQQPRLIDFPMNGEALRAETLALLQQTIWAPEENKQVRDEQFPAIWEANQTAQGIKHSFTVPPEESPFSAFSSRGWKVHVAFQKGAEGRVSQFLFRNGLYFKTEAGMGTYFNGNHESGATIYVGSMDATSAIAGYVGDRLHPLLTNGATQQFRGRTVSSGSGADIELLPKVTARFDIGKSAHVGKYVYDSGAPSWVTAVDIPTGLPFLREDARFIAELERQFQAEPQHLPELLATYRQAFSASKAALCQDFGEDYLLGTNPVRRRVLEE